MVVEASGSEQQAVGGEGDVVDLFLVAYQAVEGFCRGWVRGVRVPEVHCAVVSGGY